MKKNLLTRLTDEIKTASHAIVLTHNIDFLFVQSVVVPKLGAIDSPRLTILADAGSALESFGRQHHLLEGLGSTYRVVPVDLGPFRRFHPKAWLLANPDRAVAAIGSGNLTFGGMSANREVWACGVSDGEGANLIAALRTYVPQIVARTPLSEAVADNIAAAFDPEFPWVGGLGDPVGVAMAPAARPLLDQIGDYVVGDIWRVSVVTPFFDDEAAALVEIARRFQAPVRAYVQPSRAGLSKAAANSLPEGVSVGTASCNAGEGDRAIHAKIIAFHRKDDVILAVGSANCSRAALTTGPLACNAEMMVVQTVSPEDAGEFLAGVTLDEALPTLPDEPRSDDENDVRGAFRIIAARQEVNVVDVAFQSETALTGIEIETEQGRWPATQIDLKAGTARFRPVPHMRKVVLLGLSDEGVQMRSQPCWVDDEASLNAPATLRRLFRRLQEGQSADERRVDEYAAVLDLFRNYLRDPESARGWVRFSNAPTAAAVYDPSAVFAEGFGPAFLGASPAQGSSHSEPGDALSVIAALFRVYHDAGPSGPVIAPSSEDDEDQEDEVPKAQNPSPKPPNNQSRLLRAIHGMVEALTEPAYVQGRRPELLSAEIALAAMVLVGGLSKGDLDLATYRATTEALWQALFFGTRGGAAGAIPRRVAQLPADHRQTFISTFASARLSAVVVLWLLPIWRAADRESLWFRLSAAQFQHRVPWLFASASPAAIQAEMADLAKKTTSTEDLREINEIWLQLVRSGDALSCFANIVSRTPSAEILERTRAEVIDAGDVLWQANCLAVAVKPCKREAQAKAEVRLLGEDIFRRFRGDQLLPVSELLTKYNKEVPVAVKEEIKRIGKYYSTVLST